MKTLSIFTRRNGHKHPPLQLLNGAVNLDDAFKTMPREAFEPKRTRTVAVVFEEIVLNNEQVAMLVREARERLDLVATVLIPELDELVAIAKEEHSKGIQELETVEASIPRAAPATPEQPT